MTMKTLLLPSTPNMVKHFSWHSSGSIFDFV
jgi:hypothetical protein